MYACTSICMYTAIHMHLCVFVCVRGYIYRIYMYVYMYMYDANKKAHIVYAFHIAPTQRRFC